MNKWYKRKDIDMDDQFIAGSIKAILEKYADPIIESIGKKAKDQVLSVQFHQSYSYEDFIEGIRPNKDGEFVLIPGVFKEFVDVAKNNRDKDYFVIIDEINSNIVL